MIDDESEPGSWKLALLLGPWRRIGKNTYTNKKDEVSPETDNNPEPKPDCRSN
jgi:hypothetical protein